MYISIVHFFPIMFFILSVGCILFLVLALMFYRIFTEICVPAFRYSKHAKTFSANISKAVFELIMNISKDAYAHLETICEPDGDEDFEPYLYSPLRTCPPCEYNLSSPKEAEFIDQNNNLSEDGNAVGRRPPTRRRRVIIGNLVGQIINPRNHIDNNINNPRVQGNILPQANVQRHVPAVRLRLFE